MTVVVLEDAELADALGRAAPDEAVFAVFSSPGRLDELRRATPDPRVSYLIGDGAVVPLPDAFADVVIGAVDEAELERIRR
jgi:hypothetical protein